MNLEMTVQDSVSGTIYDLSELVESVSWDTTMQSQPGKLTFSYLYDPKVVINEGSPVSLKIDGAGVFFGYIFKRTKNQEEKVAIIAYDQMRYLKNKDTYVLSGYTASSLFEKICKDFKLVYRLLDLSTYVIPNKIQDNKALFETIQYGVDVTLANAGKWYFFYDNFGTLEFVDINRLKTLVYLGDASLTSGYEFVSSIDDDTYNQVKLAKENKTTAKRDIYIVKDSSTIRTWGTLQYFETMGEDANEAQIKARADQLLKLKNRVTKTFKWTGLGDLKVRAGSGVVIGIEELKDLGMPYEVYFMVTGCSHAFENDNHTMQLELQVSI